MPTPGGGSGNTPYPTDSCNPPYPITSQYSGASSNFPPYPGAMGPPNFGFPSMPIPGSSSNYPSSITPGSFPPYPVTQPVILYFKIYFLSNY